MLQTISNGTISNFPIHELIVLFEPIESQLYGNEIYSEREIASRQIYMKHKMAWMSQFKDEGFSITFNKARGEVPMIQ